MKKSSLTPRSQLPKSGYWYKTHRRHCVLCGNIEKYRFRVYDEPKPTLSIHRYIWEDYVCNSCRIAEQF